jgi:hypothetical protein
LEINKTVIAASSWFPYLLYLPVIFLGSWHLIPTGESLGINGKNVNVIEKLADFWILKNDFRL